MTSLTLTYTYWHYTTALPHLLDHIKVLMTFLWRFFDVPTLLSTLLAPWRRLGESYEGGFDLKDAIGTFIINSLMRLVGAVVRLTIAAFGMVILMVGAALSLTVFAAWALLPVVIGIVIGLLVSFLV